MLDLANDIRSLSDFKRNTVDLLDRLRKTGHPLVLTINGKAEVVVQDARAYQALLDRDSYGSASYDNLGRSIEYHCCSRRRPRIRGHGQLRDDHRTDRPLGDGSQQANTDLENGIGLR